MNNRWAIPTIYFSLCELLDLFYELGLAGMMIALVWVFSTVILVILISPAIPIAQWVEQQMAMLLNVPFGLHQFWPRWLAMQSAILTCTFVIAFLTGAFTYNKKNSNGSAAP